MADRQFANAAVERLGMVFRLGHVLGKAVYVGLFKRPQ